MSDAVEKKVIELTIEELIKGFDSKLGCAAAINYRTVVWH